MSSKAGKTSKAAGAFQKHSSIFCKKQTHQAFLGSVFFSGAGEMYDEDRNILSAERTGELLFLAFNLPIVEFKY